MKQPNIHTQEAVLFLAIHYEVQKHNDFLLPHYLSHEKAVYVMKTRLKESYKSNEIDFSLVDYDFIVNVFYTTNKPLGGLPL